MRRVILLAAAVLVAALLGVLAAWLLAPRPEGPTLPRGGDFTLDSADGPVALERLRGKVVLLYFGYASCPDVCPTSLALTTAALKMLEPDELARVQVLFISVDPGRDTTEKLKQYAGYFHPNIAGVTASPGRIAAVAADYGASYRVTPVESAAGYVVDHSSVTSVIAPDGRLVEQLPHGTIPPDVAAAIRRWLPR